LHAPKNDLPQISTCSDKNRVASATRHNPHSLPSLHLNRMKPPVGSAVPELKALVRACGPQLAPVRHNAAVVVAAGDVRDRKAEVEALGAELLGHLAQAQLPIVVDAPHIDVAALRERKGLAGARRQLPPVLRLQRLDLLRRVVKG